MRKKLKIRGNIMNYRKRLLSSPMGLFFILFALILHVTVVESPFSLFIKGLFFGLSIPLNISFIYFSVHKINNSSL